MTWQQEYAIQSLGPASLLTGTNVLHAAGIYCIGRQVDTIRIVSSYRYYRQHVHVQCSCILGSKELGL